MLQVGSAKLSDAEARSHFAAWCISSAPLILGFDLTDPAALARAQPIVGNSRAIGINQAWHGSAGHVLSASPQTFNASAHQGAGDGSGRHVQLPLWQVWTKPLAADRAALLLLNIGPSAADITASLAALKIGEGIALSDVWTGKAVAHSGDSYTAKAVPAHGSVFLLAEAKKG